MEPLYCSSFITEQKKLATAKRLISIEIENAKSLPTMSGIYAGIAEVLRVCCHGSPLENIAKARHRPTLLKEQYTRKLQKAIIETIVNELLEDDIGTAIEYCKEIGLDTEKLELEMESF